VSIRKPFVFQATLNLRSWRASYIKMHRVRQPLRPHKEWFDLILICVHPLSELYLCKAFKFSGRSSPISHTWRDVFTVPIQVTAGRSCYKPSDGLKINSKQSIAAFFSKTFPDPIKAKIQRYPEWMQSRTGFSHSVSVGRGNIPSLQIYFMRTVRVEANKKNHSPPMGLGTLPLLNTQPYRHQLPPGVAAKGGLFIPMYGA
jgi:hypothetical protein